MTWVKMSISSTLKRVIGVGLSCVRGLISAGITGRRAHARFALVELHAIVLRVQGCDAGCPLRLAGIVAIPFALLFGQGIANGLDATLDETQMGAQRLAAQLVGVARRLGIADDPAQVMVDVGVAHI